MAASALLWALRAARQVLPSQTRGYYVDWRMLRDVKRRRLAYEYADERLRINAIRKNTILPKELQVSLSKPDPGRNTRRKHERNNSNPSKPAAKFMFAMYSSSKQGNKGGMATLPSMVVGGSGCNKYVK
ncbi:hypothetical protein ASZ78_006776 [Callipepla squamata]|uniref:Mitochondrial ribosomal protein S14 n=1 Tax=Callipepla squamata TaxID=9009 RepID=A0A226MW07_CALSU|nr:hypothetical protein ASZ78_006776 [Callipepla squamata]